MVQVPDAEKRRALKALFLGVLLGSALALWGSLSGGPRRSRA